MFQVSFASSSFLLTDVCVHDLFLFRLLEFHSLPKTWVYLSHWSRTTKTFLVNLFLGKHLLNLKMTRRATPLASAFAPLREQGKGKCVQGKPSEEEA